MGLCPACGAVMTGAAVRLCPACGIALADPDSVEVVEGLVGGLRGLRAESIAERREMVAQLCALADRDPENARIAAGTAWEVQRVMVGAVYDLDEARRLVGVLGRLAERRYSDGGEQLDDRGLAVATLCAEGLALFTSFPGVSGDEVRRVVAQLRELSARYPEVSRIAAMLAVGLHQLALGGGLKKSEIRDVIEELGRIAALDHGEFSSEPYRIAQHLHALSMTDVVDVDGARAAVAEFGRLLDRDPPVADIVTRWEIARLYASGLHGLMNRAGATQADIRTARLELGRLSYTHSGDPEIDRIVWLLDERTEG